jgi:glucose-6-phosphate 1-dehydrogenase
MSGFETVRMEEPKSDACTVVIFGASGDLTKRKLIPALYRLASTSGPGVSFQVLGIGKETMSAEQFRAHLYEGVRASKETAEIPDHEWGEFARRVHYFSGDLTSRDIYESLATRLDVIKATGGSPNRLFYCSTPPSLAGSIVGGLSGVGLASEEKGWSRVVIEKPFGRDLHSARALNETVASVFQEHQVYRIDHYLGKETVQNLLVFRFGNILFEPVWNRNYVEYVEITAAETVGTGGRAGYYEEAGALRDMVANHLLQLLTLVAMEPPVAFDAESVREEKVQVLRSIRPMTPEEVTQRTIRGQYEPGAIEGADVSGYRQEFGVSPASTTETYVAVQFAIQNWRWAGVPFYVRTGKRLARQLTEVNVHFKRTPHALFADVAENDIQPNVVSLRIQPDEAVRVTFGAKRPGTEMRTATVQMDFGYETGFGIQSPTAYETLLLDAIEGDATLFTRRDEVENEWRLITPILDAWRDLHPSTVASYDAGSSGPSAADLMLARNGHAWRPLVRRSAGAVKGKTGVLTWPSTRLLKM